MKESSKVKTYCVLGVMSGTSLDGLDLALTNIKVQDGSWSFDLIKASSIAYNKDWKDRLQNAFHSKEEEIELLDTAFGQLIGQEVNLFLEATDLRPEFIASHGHTIFHQPDQGVTVQVGSAKEIFELTRIPVINDFRSKDVSLGGQGAPLVPIGDRYFFSDFNYCLNLGGIANISHETAQGRLAYDISPINMALNYLANQMDLGYDDKGEQANQGQLITEMYEELNAIPYCKQPPPKSLGYEEFLEYWKPILDRYSEPIIDKLHTTAEHVAYQISKTIKGNQQPPSLLATGGGALNDYFISRLTEISQANIVVPSKEIIEFKEAIVFGLLGVLRLRNEVNCLASVTGAKSDNCGGEMYGF